MNKLAGGTESKRNDLIGLRNSLKKKRETHRQLAQMVMKKLLLLLSHFSRVRLPATPETAAHQAPLGFSRQEHWSGLPFPLHYKKVKSESEVAQSCPTPSDPTDCSLPGSSAHGIFQARVLEWGAIAFSGALLFTSLCSYRYYYLPDSCTFPSAASGKEPTCQCRRLKRCGLDPWVRKIPWRRRWQPAPVFLPGKSCGQRSQAGYSPWGRKESDMTEHTLAARFLADPYNVDT